MEDEVKRYLPRKVLLMLGGFAVVGVVAGTLADIATLGDLAFSEGTGKTGAEPSPPTVALIGRMPPPLPTTLALRPPRGTRTPPTQTIPPDMPQASLAEAVFNPVWASISVPNSPNDLVADPETPSKRDVDTDSPLLQEVRNRGVLDACDGQRLEVLHQRNKVRLIDLATGNEFDAPLNRAVATGEGCKVEFQQFKRFTSGDVAVLSISKE